MERINMEKANLLMNEETQDELTSIASDMININNTVEIIIDNLESEANALVEILHSNIPKLTVERFTTILFYLLTQNRECAERLVSIEGSAKLIPDSKTVWAQFEKQA